MSASDHINPRLFHGTAHYFGDNEVIEPTMNHFQKSETSPLPEHREKWLNSNLVHASTSFSRAQSMAAYKAQSEGKLFGPVYEVPSESFTMVKDLIDPKRVDDINRDIAVSLESVKPTKIVGWGTNPDVDEDNMGDGFYGKKKYK